MVGQVHLEPDGAAAARAVRRPPPPPAASARPRGRPSAGQPRWNRGGRRPSAAGTARWRCPQAARPAGPRSPPRSATVENVAGCGATADRSQRRDARARSTRRCRRARPCERGPRLPAHGQDWRASSSTDAIRYQLRHAPAPGPPLLLAAVAAARLSFDGRMRSQVHTRSTERFGGGVRCRISTERPLNPFAAPRDQREERTQEPQAIKNKGIKNKKPPISHRRIRPRNEKGCDRRVRPHPPPRRSTRPARMSPSGRACFLSVPGCDHTRAAISTQALAIAR